MKTSILILTIFLLISQFAHGRKKEVIYLKNGSIVRGKIMFQDPGKLVKLRTSDNNIWVFDMNQVDSISRPVQTTEKAISKTGYFNLTELGVLAGNTSNYKTEPFTMMNINSWKFKEGFTAGIGLGVEFFNESYLPVVADFRYFLRSSGVMPFVGLQGGYSIPLGDTNNRTIYNYGYGSRAMIYPGPMPTTQDYAARGGLLFNPAVGIQMPINESLALTLSAGYRWMRHSYGKDADYRLDVDYNRLSLKIGLLFK